MGDAVAIYLPLICELPSALRPHAGYMGPVQRQDMGWRLALVLLLSGLFLPRMCPVRVLVVAVTQVAAAQNACEAASHCMRGRHRL